MVCFEVAFALELALDVVEAVSELVDLGFVLLVPYFELLYFRFVVDVLPLVLGYQVVDSGLEFDVFVSEILKFFVIL